MKWAGRLLYAALLLACFCAAPVYDYLAGSHPERTPPYELYAVVQRHLAACRWSDFPLAYHAASNAVQERFSLVQFEHKLRRDYRPVASARHVEFGAIHGVRGNRSKVMVDVYFISPRGEAAGWTYTLVFEDGDWKIDGAEPTPGWPTGQRLSGVRA